MKDLLKNYGLILLLSLIGVMLLTNLIGNCTDKKTEQVVNDTSVSLDRNNALDSLKREMNKEKIKALDSATLVSDTRIELLEKRIANRTNETNRLKKQNSILLDSLNNNQTIENCEKVVESQSGIIAEQDSTITDLTAEAEEYSHKNYLLTEKIKIKDLDIALLEASKQRDSTAIDTYKKRLTKQEKTTRTGNFIRNGLITILTIIAILK